MKLKDKKVAKEIEAQVLLEIMNRNSEFRSN